MVPSKQVALDPETLTNSLLLTFRLLFCYYVNMARQLSRDGLRKCYVCKQIYPLDFENFHRRIKPYKGNILNKGFTSECKKCLCKRKNGDKRKIKILSGLRCNKCGIEHENHKFFDVDHVIPLRRRTNKISEHRAKPRLKDYESGLLQVLCPNCHRLKTLSEFH